MYLIVQGEALKYNKISDVVLKMVQNSKFKEISGIKVSVIRMSQTSVEKSEFWETKQTSAFKVRYLKLNLDVGGKEKSIF